MNRVAICVAVALAACSDPPEDVLLARFNAPVETGAPLAGAVLPGARFNVTGVGFEVKVREACRAFGEVVLRLSSGADACDCSADCHVSADNRLVLASPPSRCTGECVFDPGASVVLSVASAPTPAASADEIRVRGRWERP